MASEGPTIGVVVVGEGTGVAFVGMYGEPGSRTFVALACDLGDYFFIDSRVRVSAHVVVAGDEGVLRAWLEIVDAFF